MFKMYVTFHIFFENHVINDRLYRGLHSNILTSPESHFDLENIVGQFNLCVESMVSYFPTPPFRQVMTQGHLLRSKSNSQLTLFQNPQILWAISSGHDVITTPALFPVWGLL